MTTSNESHDPIALFTDLPIDLPIDVTLVIDKDHAHIQEITTVLQDIHLHIYNLLDQKILDFLYAVHIQMQETNSVQYNHNTKKTQLLSKYTCITQLKWQTL